MIRLAPNSAELIMPYTSDFMQAYTISTAVPAIDSAEPIP